MNFAFLVHPLGEEAVHFLGNDGKLRKALGWDLLGFLNVLHSTLVEPPERPRGAAVRVIDELPGLESRLQARAEGRLYEIPMDSLAILEDPGRALEYMRQAVDLASDWGAKIIGLGSMTGIVGGHGTDLAEYANVSVTTGNSLTVYAAVQNLLGACRAVDLDLSEEVVAVVGIPGSIATAAAAMLASRCKTLLLVGRRSSNRALAIASRLNAELTTDIAGALSRARVVLSATSSGGCIDQRWLRPGSLVSDVGVPTDVVGGRPLRDDCLVLTGGLSQAPDTMSLESQYLFFHNGSLPSCLGETIVLALENRMENFSLGRNLDCARIEEIGRLAESHGFDFTRLYSFGLPLDESSLVGYRKVIAKHSEKPKLHGSGRNGVAGHHGPTAASLGKRAIDRHRRYIDPVLVTLMEGAGVVKAFVKGQGNHVWDSAGLCYLDFVAGYGSVNLGHNHPDVVAAVQAALAGSAPGFSPAAVNPFATALAERLATVSPRGLEMTFFCNSGTEAVEAALKLARTATGRPGLLHCERSFHGKSLGSLSVTGNPVYQRPFEPLVPGCESVPFGDIEALERMLIGRRFAAFIVEPVQAEGGMIVPPAGYLPAAQELCRKTDTLLVIDEVQTGLGRTGTLFAVEQAGVEPDVMTLAKSLGGGLIPIGAMLCRRDLWSKAVRRRAALRPAHQHLRRRQPGLRRRPGHLEGVERERHLKQRPRPQPSVVRGLAGTAGAVSAGRARGPRPRAAHRPGVPADHGVDGRPAARAVGRAEGLLS